jgi:lipopolysaccharide/colanic/teichoic acid biosynthesis glycosyltransferase
MRRKHEHSEATFAEENDQRVLRIGRFLRRWRIDELPQLVNVLRGEMSLVGPRPETPHFVEKLTRQLPVYRERVAGVKPGITGLAQISGRNAISWGERKLLDLEYVDNWSNALDLKILLKTIPYVLLSRDVYIDPQQESGDNRNENSLHR